VAKRISSRYPKTIISVVKPKNFTGIALVHAQPGKLLQHASINRIYPLNQQRQSLRIEGIELRIEPNFESLNFTLNKKCFIIS